MADPWHDEWEKWTDPITGEEKDKPLKGSTVVPGAREFLSDTVAQKQAADRAQTAMGGGLNGADQGLSPMDASAFNNSAGGPRSYGPIFPGGPK